MDYFFDDQIDATLGTAELVIEDLKNEKVPNLETAEKTYSDMKEMLKSLKVSRQKLNKVIQLVDEIGRLMEFIVNFCRNSEGATYKTIGDQLKYIMDLLSVNLRSILNPPEEVSPAQDQTKEGATNEQPNA